MEITDKIILLIDEGINSDVYTFASVGIYINNDFIKVSRCNDKKYNKENNIKYIFDIASLTKSLSTVLSILSLKNSKVLDLNYKLSDIFDIYEEFKEKYNITISDLLSHSSGFPAHKSYFEKINQNNKCIIRDFYLKTIISEPLEYSPGTQSIYSDVGYILLGFIIEKLSGQNIDDYLKKNILEPIGLQDGIFFRPLDRIEEKDGFFVPMDECPWRMKLMKGEVSDENCWALGGVSGHAGLFGDIDSVLGLTALILDIWKGRKNHPNINREDLCYFLKKRKEIKENTWALGFDTPSPSGSSSGRYFSPKSVGHLGFTGTSFWIDPEKDLVIVLLTNRINPSRDNNKIKEFRPWFHDRVIEILGLV